jgi:hypothetical protein
MQETQTKLTDSGCPSRLHIANILTLSPKHRRTERLMVQMGHSRHRHKSFPNLSRPMAIGQFRQTEHTLDFERMFPFEADGLCHVLFSGF